MPAAGSVAPQTQGFVGQHAAPVHVPAFTGAASDNVASEYGQGHSLHKNVSYKISDKTEHSGLYAFSGNVADFKAWQKRMEDHMAKSTQKYRTLLAKIAASRQPILRTDLMQTELDGFNAWEIAIEMESFTMRFLGKDLFQDRFDLCGNEDLNGMELSRNLCSK